MGRELENDISIHYLNFDDFSYTDMLKLIKLYTLSMYNLLYVNYASVKL